MANTNDIDFPLGFSIVLCTFNGKSKIEKTLLYLSKLVIPIGYLVELILIDNASTDNTQEFVQQLWKNNYGCPYLLKIVEEKRAGKGYAIELGYDVASYSYILTVDDDNWLNKDYLINYVTILKENKDIDVIQGKSEGVFEEKPPDWIDQFRCYFIIGSPIPKSGFFESGNFSVWGAGMVIRNKDWTYLRHLGFSFLTSKVAGKAAGEDNETAIALLMMDKKIFFSDSLTYQHYMPKERITWNKLEQNFATFGYVDYYLFLYSLAFDSLRYNYEITQTIVYTKFLKYWFGRMRWFSIAEHLKYYSAPKKSIPHLQILQHLNLLKYFLNFRKKSLNDIRSLKFWMQPVIAKYGDNFNLPL